MKGWERFERTLNFQETEGVCTFDIINHPGIFERFADPCGDVLEKNGNRPADPSFAMEGRG